MEVITLIISTLTEFTEKRERKRIALLQIHSSVHVSTNCLRYIQIASIEMSKNKWSISNVA